MLVMLVVMLVVVDSRSAGAHARHTDAVDLDGTGARAGVARVGARSTSTTSTRITSHPEIRPLAVKGTALCGSQFQRWTVFYACTTFDASSMDAVTKSVQCWNDAYAADSAKFKFLSLRRSSADLNSGCSIRTKSTKPLAGQPEKTPASPTPRAQPATAPAPDQCNKEVTIWGVFFFVFFLLEQLLTTQVLDLIHNRTHLIHTRTHLIHTSFTPHLHRSI